MIFKFLLAVPKKNHFNLDPDPYEHPAKMRIWIQIKVDFYSEPL